MPVHLTLMKDPVFFMAECFMSDMKKYYLLNHDESGGRTEESFRAGWMSFSEYIAPIFPKDFPMEYMAPYFASMFVILEKALYDPHREMYPDEVMGYMMMQELSERDVYSQPIYDASSIPAECLIQHDIEGQEGIRCFRTFMASATGYNR